MNLIAHDLVIVQPLSSMSGYITYIDYQFASNKGGITAGQSFANPFALGEMTDERVNYTGARVVEHINAEGGLTFAWDTAIAGTVEVEVKNLETEKMEWTAVPADKLVLDDKERVTGIATGYMAEGTRVRYIYNNVVIPQNDLPMVKAEVKSIALVAKARRIAVYYSQMAAFQAKSDYGVDLGDQLAEKAVGELSYEIDTEIIDLLDEIAGEIKPELVFDKTLPVGVSKRDHYAGFAEVVEIAKQIIYDATQKFAPNWMVCSSSVLPVLSMIDSFKAAATGAVNGPYMAGTFGSLKVFVSPRMPKGKYLVGVNGGDMMSAAAVYAPYMAIVPTQLLQYADGGNSQGFSTLYAIEKLNTNLVIAGEVK